MTAFSRFNVGDVRPLAQFRLSWGLAANLILIALFPLNGNSQPSTHGAGPASLSPAHLETESLTNPIGVDEERPDFSWQLTAVPSNARDLRQTAYRIVVSSSARMLAEGIGDAWDTGKVQSAGQLGIKFGGKALQPETRYRWKVMVWDQANRPSHWGNTASWYTGMMSPSAWSAHWIAATVDAPSPPPTREGVDMPETHPGRLPMFRRSFLADKPIASAVVAVSGLGQYELRINGQNVTASVMNPGWTNYRKRVFYNMYDVSSLLKTGENVLGVMLGNGMYHVPDVPGRYTKFSGSFGQPKLILQLTVRYRDGSVTKVVTDSSWRTAPGPITFSSIYGGEDYDARYEQAGWDRPLHSRAGSSRAGYRSEDWKPAVEVPGPGGTLVAQLLPPVVVAQTFRPINITHPSGRSTVYDLGMNFSGWPNIVVRGPSGTHVKLLAGELLDATGHVTQASNDAHPGRENSFRYTLNGTSGKGASGGEAWHPQFSYNGFRYVEVEPSSASADNATGKPVVVALSGSFLHDGVAVTGQFTASSALFSNIHKLIDQAILSNMVSVLTDCPTREKLGWLEQTHLAATSIMYSYDVRRLYDKMADDMADSQTATGLVPAIAPEFVAFVDAQGNSTAFRDTPEWGSASILSPLAAYRFYGDREILSRHFETMQRYVAYLGSRTEDHMLAYGLGDWYDIGPGDPGESQLTGKSLTASTIYYQDLLGMAQIAGVLGQPEKATQYAHEAALVKDAFNRKLFHSDTGKYDRGSQTAQAMPLVLGLVPEARRRDVLNNLVADIRAHNNHVTAGDIGFHYVVRALTDGGRSDVLADMLSRTDSPSYGFQLARGATSLTEAWDSKPESSQNHFMLGHAEEWFYRGLAGIDVDMSRPEAEKLHIRPTPVSAVSSAEASVDTVYGTVKSAWKKVPSAVNYSAVQYDISIPAGQSATVTLPAASAKIVTESGRALSMDRTRSTYDAFGALTLVLGSGSYHFLVSK